ncbi:F-box protein CPR1-like [Rutidosis leptorrhynchoides]|uniref:F-box protein CPR1-like n=1 Tax=Rutidosis leptorrhynchoides TaxID=125765 RepID=UPI003A9A15BC
MSHIPQDVQAEIFSRLPVKSLLRFSAVSKSLRALIDSPSFAKLHLNNAEKSSKILTFLGDFDPPNSIYCLRFDSDTTVAELETPFDSIGPFHNILGSCNGLLCLSRGASDRDILLWSPLTKKYKLINAPIRYPSGLNTFIIDRIGYDHVNDDYKLIRLKRCSRSDLKSVKSKQRGHGVSRHGQMSHGVYISGAIHWVVTQNPPPDLDYLIVAFDVSGETFEMVPQPEYYNKYVAIDLGMLDECLCVIGNYAMYRVDVWVMMKYGVKESWKKLVAVNMFDAKMNVWPNVRPIIYLKDGKQVLLEVDNEWFVRYDLEKKKSKVTSRTKLYNVSNMSTFVCQETLTLV